MKMTQAPGSRLRASARAHAATLLTTALVALVAVAVALAAVDVKVEHDESFDFASAHTWAWHPEGAGKVITMTSKYDNAEEIQQRLEPTILAAIEAELLKRGLTHADSGEPDFYVSYYLLLRIGASSQQMGQFINPALGAAAHPWRDAEWADVRGGLARDRSFEREGAPNGLARRGRGRGESPAPGGRAPEADPRRHRPDPRAVPAQAEALVSGFRLPPSPKLRRTAEVSTKAVSRAPCPEPPRRSVVQLLERR